MRKLVRDNIPDIIRETGVYASFRVESKPEERLALLKRKLIEEAEEVKAEKERLKVAEELADVWEVMNALMIFFNIEEEFVREIRERKARERGAFSQFYVLETPEEARSA